MVLKERLLQAAVPKGPTFLFNFSLSKVHSSYPARFLGPDNFTRPSVRARRRSHPTPPGRPPRGGAKVAWFRNFCEYRRYSRDDPGELITNAGKLPVLSEARRWVLKRHEGAKGTGNDGGGSSCASRAAKVTRSNFSGRRALAHLPGRRLACRALREASKGGRMRAVLLSARRRTKPAETLT